MYKRQVIISPGIKPDHYLLEQLMSKNVSVKTDIDIFSEHYKGNVIGVTGTNGKTTFVNELNKFLNINNVHSASAGNIGISPLDLIDTSYEYISPVFLSYWSGFPLLYGAALSNEEIFPYSGFRLHHREYPDQEYWAKKLKLNLVVDLVL